jgi:hypothetical protein
LIDIDTHDVMTELRHRRRMNSPEIATTDDRDPHVPLRSREAVSGGAEPHHGFRLEG